MIHKAKIKSHKKVHLLKMLLKSNETVNILSNKWH